MSAFEATGFISGNVYKDANGNAQRDAGELGLDAWQIYCDENDNGTQDPGEPTATSDTDGNYTLNNILSSACHAVKLVQQEGFVQTTAEHTVVGAGQTGVDFGVKPLQSVTIEVLQGGSEDPDPEHPSDGPQPIIFQVARSGGTSQDATSALTIPVSFSGTTIAADFADALPTSVTINEGESSAKLTITPLDDDEVEDDQETLVAALQDSSGSSYTCEAPASQPTATGKVNDNDFKIVGADVAYMTGFGVKRDADGTTYESPEWLDLNGDGAVSGDGEHAFPVSLRASHDDTPSSADVTATFRLDKVLSGDYQIHGVATGLIGGDIVYDGPASADVSTGMIVADLNSSRPLADVIDRADLQIHWTITRTPPAGAAKAKTVDYGDSTNRVYVSLTPNAPEFETVLDIACRSAKGKSAREDVISAIWSEFTPRTLKNVNGDPLKYWGGYASQNGNPADVFSLDGLLAHRDGRCEAWSRLLIAVYQNENVSSHLVAITPNGAGMTVPEFCQLVTMQFGYRQLSAQNAPIAPTAYPNHGVVRLDDDTTQNRIFDPSYGNLFSGASTAAAEKDFQDTAGYFVKYYFNDGSIQNIPFGTTPQSQMYFDFTP